MSVTNSVPNATENVVEIVIPSGTASKLFVNLTVAPGAGKSRTITLRKSGASQTLTCTVSAAATTCNDTTHSVSFVNGDRIAVLHNQSAGAPAASQVQFGFQMTAP